MINILPSRTEKQSFKNCSLSGFSMPLSITHASTNTAFASGIWVPNLFTVRATLKRWGKETILFSDNLENVLTTTEIFNPVYEYLKDTSKNITTLAAGVGVYATGIIPLELNFGSVINLMGDDELVVEVTANPGAFSTTLANQNSSFMTLDKKDAIGIEYFTPKVRSEVIPTSAANYGSDLGDNVTRVVLLQLDKTTRLTADQVATSFNFVSDRKNSIDTVAEVYARNNALYADAADAAVRLQTLVLHDGAEVDRCRVDFTFNGANVTASKNFIGSISFETSQMLLARAYGLSDKHKKADLTKLARG
jgi:hypothetical protein